MRSISKLMVGVAVAGACGYTAAATITTTAGLPNSGTANYSRQGAILNGNTNLLQSDVTVVLQDTYVQFDTLRLGMVNGSFSSADVAGGHTASFVCSAGAAVGSILFTYTQASSGPSALVFTAANPGAGTTSTAGMSCVIPSVFVSSRSLTSNGNVQIDSRSVKAAGNTYDLGAARTIATVSDQFSISTTLANSLNGVVETNGGRLSFTTTSADTFNGWNADTLGVTLTNSGLNNSVAAGSMVLTLTASSSLAFLQEPDGVTGVAGGSCTATSGTGVAGVTVTGTAGSISFPSAGNSGTCAVLIASVNTVVTGTYTIGLGRTGAATTTNSTAFTAPQSFTVAATAGSGTLTLASLASTAAGSWSLSGTTADLAYVPLGSSTNLQLFVSNTSNQSGTVTFTAWNGSSNSSCTGTLGTVDPGSQASFGSALKTALQACTGAGWSTATRAAVQIVSTTPSVSTEIHSAFSASDSVSRQLIINSTNSN